MSISIKSLGYQAFIYGTGHIAVRGIAFLLLPLYTNVFSLEDYGIISLVYTFMTFMTVTLHYGLDASLLKHYIPAEKNDKVSLLTSSYCSFIVSGLAFLLLMIIFSKDISRLIGVGNLPWISEMVSLILFFDVLWAVHVLILRAENKPIIYTLTNFLNVFLTLALNILFVLICKMGVYGVLISNLITSGFIFVITIPIIIKRISIKSLSMQKWKKLMKFGLPLLPAGIFSMIMELSDRYILYFLTDIETVGLYNSGYKIGMLMLLVVMGFNMAWQPFFLNKKKEDRDYITQVTTVILFLLVFLWILLLIWSEDIVKLQLGSVTLLGKEFWESTRIIPIIALSYIFHALYILQLPGVYLLEKSSWIAWARAIGAGSNIILNFVLIPHYGIMGAAGATCFSFLLMVVIFYLINRKIFPISYNWGKLGLISITAGLIFIIQFNYQSNLTMKIIISISYPIILIFTRVIRINQIRFILKN